MPAPDDLAVRSYSWERTTLLSGIIFAVLQIGALVFFAAFVLPGLPPVESPPEIRAAAYAEHGDVLRLGNYLLVLPIPFLLLFLGGLFSVLRRVDRIGALATATLAAGIAMAMLWPLAGIISDIGIDIARAGGDPATVSALDAIAPYSLALSAIPRTVLLGGTCVILLQSGSVARWIGWSGLAIGLLSFIGSATLVDPNVFPVLAGSTLLFELWIIALCVGLLRWRRA